MGSDKTPVTMADMDALLAFLPKFEDETFEAVWEWNPYPQYSADVEAFFRAAASPCWLDYNYFDSPVLKMVDDDALIAAATLDEIKTLLTLFLRSERFGDGNWAHYVKNGRITAVLRRIQVLREDL